MSARRFTSVPRCALLLVCASITPLAAFLQPAPLPQQQNRRAAARFSPNIRAAASDITSNDAQEFAIPPGAPEATGTLLGAIALVAGTTVGAGILALPAKTFEAGFAPSAVTLLLCWLYMSSTGLLLAEVNVNTLCALERKAVSLDSMAEETLGVAGARISGAAYVFIHYALLIAYMLQGGTLLLEYLAPLQAASALPPAAGPPLFAALAGGAVFVGSEQQVELGNNLLFGGVLIAFTALLAIGVPTLDPALLARADVPAVVPAVPVMVLSLVFHNVVPTICYQLGCDLNRIRTAITVGSAIPTAMFILWNLVILGSVAPDAAAAASSGVFDPLEGLRASGDTFGAAVRAFSILAILTSFIGFVLGLTDYFADALAGPLGINNNNNNNKQQQGVGSEQPPQAAVEGEAAAGAGGRTLSQRAALFGITLLPPLAIATGGDPSLFFAALDNAGTFGILTLFGMVPAAMAWQSRYGDEFANGDGDLAVPAVLPGGRVVLGGMAAAAAGVVALETWEKISGAVA